MIIKYSWIWGWDWVAKKRCLYKTMYQVTLFTKKLSNPDYLIVWSSK